jgi:hypothetical protein
MDGFRIMAARKMDMNDFNARIKSIKNPRNKSYYDQGLEMHVPKRVSRDKIKSAKKAEDDSVFGAMFVSMIVGAVALIIAQIVRIRYFGLIESSTVVLALELVITIWALIVLTALMKKRSIPERIAQIMGLALMMVAGHNMIWRWPDQMGVIYTATYVEHVMSTTTQHSIVYRGSVFSL